MIYDLITKSDTKTIKIYHEGEIIINQGAPLDHILVLVSGEAYTNSISLHGERDITNILTGIQFIGLIEGLNDEKYSLASVVALNECHIISAQIDDFFKEVDLDIRLTKLCLDYIGDFTLELIQNELRTRELSTEDSILNFLYLNAINKPLPVTLSFSKEFIADFFNINVRTIYRYLDKWEQLDYIQRNKNNILIDKKEIEKLSSKLEGY